MKWPSLTLALTVVWCVNIVFVLLANMHIYPPIGTFTIWHDPATGELMGGGDFWFFAWLPILDIIVFLAVFFGMRRLLR